MMMEKVDESSKRVDVLREILEWSSSRPVWQRDALRRLVIGRGLNESDLEELTALCKTAHGLADRRESVPLDVRHIPSRGEIPGSVKLTSLSHHSGVNALARDQTIEFGPALTVVYGGNAAGKSGYTRILKRACRARGAEEILGNVLAESALGRPSATIRFKVDDKDDKLAWRDQVETHDVLENVSVFDRRCAAVYVGEKTDVAFRPLGLDLFDKLSDACETVRKALEKERGELAKRQASLPEMPEGTVAHRLVSNITSLTKPDEVKKVGTLSDGERRRLTEARKRLHDLQAEDPQKTALTLTLRAQRLETLSSRLTELNEVLADATFKSLFDARDTVKTARNAAVALQATAFPHGLLTGTGSDVWRELWETARSFSNEEAYPEGQFPVTDVGARCVLCQQELEGDAAERLKRFEGFLRSTVQQELERATATYQEQQQRVANIVVTDEAYQGAIEEIRIESEQLAKSVKDALELAQQRRAKVLEAIREGQPMPAGLPPGYKTPAKQVTKEVQELRNRADQVLRNSGQNAKDELSKELRELEAREMLVKHVNIVLNEIERKKKLAAYELCLQDTNTQGITRKSSEVTKRAVTRQLAKSFQAELKMLRFTHLEVELRAAGGARGIFYHELILKRAATVALPQVVSEGEADALSIAAFFAELSTAANHSAILFDDPVSSLDHDWRECVARRLAMEANDRQVVVFTHDIVFLLALVRFAEEAGADCKHQYLRREASGTGVSSPDLPWVAMKVRPRIGVLKQMWQSAEKLHRTATSDEYEKEAVLIYGLLREAWERGLEEILLWGVVERYRPNVQTQQVKHIADITDDDCKALEAGMTKSSRWLAGHDQAPAENVPVPDPEELKQDIAALEEWVRMIQKRRT